MIIVVAGAIGYLGGRAGLAAFSSGGGSQPNVAQSRLGEATPDHARASWRQFGRAVAIWAPLWLAPTALLLVTLGPAHVFTRIAIFFSEMALVTFGGAYAVLAYVAQQAVQHYGWLTPREMLDGLGMAETTPGPLIMVVQFVGFLAAFHSSGALAPLLAATLGGLLATWVTFAPCFLWIFAGAPFIEALRDNKALTGALSAITAVVVGVILNLAVWFAVHTLFREVVPIRAWGLKFDAPSFASADPFALVLALGAGFALFGLRAGALTTLGVCAAVGALLYSFGLVAH